MCCQFLKNSQRILSGAKDVKGSWVEDSSETRSQNLIVFATSCRFTTAQVAAHLHFEYFHTFITDGLSDFSNIPSTYRTRVLRIENVYVVRTLPSVSRMLPITFFFVL